MKRLTPNALDPSFALFLLTLSLQTCIGETRFQRWKKANRDELRKAFCRTDEADFDVWARFKFREGMLV